MKMLRSKSSERVEDDHQGFECYKARKASRAELSGAPVINFTSVSDDSEKKVIDELGILV
jgi:hypothetical protein